MWTGMSICLINVLLFAQHFMGQTVPKTMTICVEAAERES